MSYDLWKLQTPEEAYPPAGICPDCGEDLYTNDSHDLGGVSYCEDCLTSCAICGTRLRKYGDEGRPDEGELLCGRCWEEVR